ncbi:MAG: monovalent cation/H(+) antiporter subunit G [Lachnospiraceae bacterium]|nr:monovalent cation/H(+) antiporter subunit G [Lachnospiraceae bacterium]
MTAEWIRFWIIAVILILGLIAFILAVIGVNRFSFVMNRMHSAGVGDSLGLMIVIIAMIIFSGSVMTALKLALLVVFMWFTAPTATHFLSQIEFYTNKQLEDHVRMKKTLESGETAPAPEDAESRGREDGD